MTSSLISFAKRDISESLPGMIIGDYNLPATEGGFILHVEDTFFYKPDIDGNQDRVAVSSAEIVESIVGMHIKSQLAYKPGTHPALFCVPNVAVTPEMLNREYKDLKSKAISAQVRWFVVLVQMADDDWQTYHHHRMISDIQRTAAKTLNLKREWLIAIEEEGIENKDCPFCGSNLLNASAPICPTCGKVHDPVKLAALEAKFNAASAKTTVPPSTTKQ